MAVPSAPAPTPPDLLRQLPALRVALLDQHRFRTDQLSRLRAEVPADDARGEVTASLRRAGRVALADIEAALDRMRTGRYGRCVACAGTVPLEQLEILPAVALCMDCQRADLPADPGTSSP